MPSGAYTRQIRNKRLAKLGASSASSPVGSRSASQSASQSTDPSPTATPPPPPPPPATAESSGSPNPFAQLGVKQDDGSKSRINITSATSSTPQKRDGDGAARPKPRSPAPESVDAWEDKTLAHIFRISLKPDVTSDVHGNTLYLAQGVRDDLLEQSQPLLLKTPMLDQALTEAASQLPAGTTPLDYLLNCWKRVSRALRSLRSGDAANPRYQTIKEARRLCMSYCIFAVTMPEMFGQEATGNPLTRHLLVDPESETGLCTDFLSEAVARFDEDETIRDALVEAAIQLSSELASLTMNDNYRPYITVSATIAEIGRHLAR